MANMFLRDTISSQVFRFTYDSHAFDYMSRTVYFHYRGTDGFIAPNHFHTSVSGIVNYTVTAELTINQDGQTATSGQFTLARSTNISNTVTYYDYFDESSNPGYKLYMPWNDGRLVTIHIIIRVDGSIQKDTTFQTASPINYSVSSVSPAPTTGKVCTVNLANSVVNNSYWKMSTPFRVYAYHNTSSSAEYTWYYVGAYINDGTTLVNANASGFSSFQFYFDYVDGRAKTDNNGQIRATFTVQTVDLWVYDSSYSYAVYHIDISYLHNFTWTYVNQIDNAAGPRFNSITVTPTPSGLIEEYGKYIGGSITKLLHNWNATWRFGASFSEITYSLYNATNDVLIKSWTYSSMTTFTLTLESTVDKTQYMTVTIKMSNGASTTAKYPTFQVYGYSNPEIISLNASRCNQDGTPNDSGAYCKISYQFRVTALDNQNQKKVTLVAPDGSHVYTNLDYNHGSAYQYISAADIEHSYAISLAVEDDFMSVTRSMNISTAGVIMDFLYDGKGIGLGKVSETSEMVEVNPQWTFKADKMTFKGQDLETILTSLGYVFPT